MIDAPDRTELLDLLNRLGDTEDGPSLGAARELHRLVVVEGPGWDALLRPDDPEPLAPPPPDEEHAPPADAVAEGSAATAADRETLERLLARTDISEATREELEGLRSDLEEGSFSQMDSNYLRALEERLRPS